MQRNHDLYAKSILAYSDANFASQTNVFQFGHIRRIVHLSFLFLFYFICFFSHSKTIYIVNKIVSLNVAKRNKHISSGFLNSHSRQLVVSER